MFKLLRPAKDDNAFATVTKIILSYTIAVVFLGVLLVVGSVIFGAFL